MSTLTITLDDERLAKLREIAERFNLKAEDLARVGIEELLAWPEESFRHAADHILHKNAELYRRLSDAEVDATLREVGGKGQLRKVFR